MNADDNLRNTDGCESETSSESQSLPEHTVGSEPTLIGWLWRMCIPLIPCVGFPLYVILLCIWSFGGRRSETLRTWAKAALIAAVIQLLLIAVIFAAVQLSGTDIIGLISVFIRKF